MRTKRCTPLSPASMPYAFSPAIWTVAVLIQASSPGVESITVAPSPFCSAQRRYMRRSISAQSCDSVPPAPGLMVTIAFRRSFSPARSVFVSSSDKYASAEASSLLTSSRRESRCESSASSRARLKYVSMSLDLVSRIFSALTRSSTCLRCCKTPCAFSWFCQKSGSLTFTSRAASCFRAESASKKAPHELDALFELGVALLQVFDVFSHFFFAFIFLGCAWLQPEKQKHCGSKHTEPREPVAETRVQRQISSEIVGSVELASNIGRQLRDDASVRIDRGGETVVRIAQQPAPAFHRAHSHHHQVLDGSGGTAEPAVIRNGDQQLRTGGGEPARFTRKNRLVTNERAEAASRNFPHAIRRSRREIGNIGGQASRESEPPAQRHVLAEGHEMNLIIGINSPAGRVQKHGAVGSEPGFIRGLFPVHDADQEIRSRIARDANCTRGKSRILPVERRGNFGPNDPLRGAGIFLGCSNADACELIQFPGVELQPVGWILLRLRKIRLDQVRDVMRRRGRNQIAAT